ncbi:hypothetical protein [Halomonas getboli]|uniref:hypothetical protein n=1 Tax=Halomonas getboli TaxID=2935862 RepID=UPI0020000B8C|nr:hypothetical protein [Halomonas getboli]MCK2183038.1 hypothetical protein [Halomonas getboli]
MSFRLEGDEVRESPTIRYYISSPRSVSKNLPKRPASIGSWKINFTGGWTLLSASMPEKPTSNRRRKTSPDPTYRAELLERGEVFQGQNPAKKEEGVLDETYLADILRAWFLYAPSLFLFAWCWVWRDQSFWDGVI